MNKRRFWHSFIALTIFLSTAIYLIPSSYSFIKKSGLLPANDTVQLYFVGFFPKHESYIIKYNGKQIRSFTADKGCFGIPKVSIETDFIVKEHSLFPLTIEKRNGNRGTFHDTQLNITCQNGRKNLIIYRDYRMKDDFALNYVWQDSIRPGDFYNWLQCFPYPEIDTTVRKLR